MEFLNWLSADKDRALMLVLIIFVSGWVIEGIIRAWKDKD